jgi:hypothetical protein
MVAMRKIIFLDVDGVLNSLAFRGRDDLPPGFGGLVDPALDYYARLIDSAALDLLADLVRTTEAELVLSSAWRMKPIGVNRLERIFAALGHLLGFVGRTPLPKPVGGSTLLAGRPRGSEIAEWLLEHPDVEAIAILDDEPGGMGRMARWLVQTDIATGLMQTHVEKAKTMLAQPGPLTIHSQAALQLRSDRGPLEPGEHVWFTVGGVASCSLCGMCRRADGQSWPCRGPVHIGLREGGEL